MRCHSSSEISRNGVCSRTEAFGHRNVHAAERRCGLVNHRLHRRGISDIREHRQRANAERAHFRRDAIDGGLIAVAVQHHVCSKARVRQCNGAADILAGAGDQRGAAHERPGRFGHNRVSFRMSVALSAFPASI